jgi:hypothetical protein
VKVVTPGKQSAYERMPDSLPALVLRQNRDRSDVGAERAVRNRPRVADANTLSAEPRTI